MGLNGARVRSGNSGRMSWRQCPGRLWQLLLLHGAGQGVDDYDGGIDIENI